jgi:plastocyanin
LEFRLKFEVDRYGISTTAGGVLILVLIVIVGIGVYLASAASTYQTGVATTPSSSAPTVYFYIPPGSASNQSLKFIPPAMTVAPGTMVVFVNQDQSSHDIDFTSIPSGAAISPNPSPQSSSWSNQALSVTLTVPGNYVFVCDGQPWLNGTVTVT